MERLTKVQKYKLNQRLYDMRRRCYDKENEFYNRYGGRGNKVCDEWMDEENGLENFVQWALDKGFKTGMLIERINNDGDYCPENCKWATAREQALNRSNNNLITINGVTMPLVKWAERIGISANALTGRIRYGWSDDELLKPKFRPLNMSKAEMSAKIREYMQLEEAGLLIKLPVRAGQKVWARHDGRIRETRIFSVEWNSEYGLKIDTHIATSRTIWELGKNVFLTLEEAEAAI